MCSVSVEPPELRFPAKLHQPLKCSILLLNKVHAYIAFKVKPTHLNNKFCINPTTGVIKPNSTCKISVKIGPQTKFPNDMQSMHTFLLLCFIMDSEELNLEMFNKEYGYVTEEYKLRAIYVLPPQLPSATPEGSEEGPIVHQAFKKRRQRVKRSKTVGPPLSSPSTYVSDDGNSGTTLENAAVCDWVAMEKKANSENEELARKEEVVLRKEAAPAKIRERSPFKERAKSEVVEERKKCNTKQAQSRAELKALKEAEYKEEVRVIRERRKAWETAMRKRRKAWEKALEGISEAEPSGYQCSESTLPANAAKIGEQSPLEERAKVESQKEAEYKENVRSMRERRKALEYILKGISEQEPLSYPESEKKRVIENEALARREVLRRKDAADSLFKDMDQILEAEERMRLYIEQAQLRDELVAQKEADEARARWERRKAWEDSRRDIREAWVKALKGLTQTRAVPPPPPPPSGNKKRMQPWLWDLLLALVGILVTLTIMAIRDQIALQNSITAT